MSARKGAPPYAAQLKRFLAKEELPLHFSAATLAQEFELRPKENRRTTINNIHQELRKAWVEGRVVAYVAANGEHLREAELCVNGSAAVAHPQIFGRPGATSPDPDYMAMSYDDYLALSHGDANGPALEAEAPARPEQEIEPEQEQAPERAVDQRTIEQAKEAIAAFEVTGPAPVWLPDRLLAQLVSLPQVLKTLRAGLDQAQGAERLALIRTGIGRKGQISSPAAAKLAQLCRDQQVWWSRCFNSAVAQYINWGEAIEDADLPALWRAPDDFYLANDERYQPEVVVLCGIMLGAPEQALADVAELAVSELEEEEVERALGVEESLRQRAATQEAELVELRRQLKEAQQSERQQRKRSESLEAELERARDEARDAGSIDERLKQAEQRATELSQQLAEARAQLEGAAEAAQRAGVLEQQLAALESERDELSVHAELAREERARRHRAEAGLQDQAAEVRRLQDELQRAREAGVFASIDDPQELLRTLARPIGDAAALAAKRLASGAAGPDDARLLAFSASFGELASTLGEQPQRADAIKPPRALPPSATQATAELHRVAEAPPAAPPEPSAAERAVSTESPAAPSEPRPTPARSRARRVGALFTITPAGGAGEVGGSALIVTSRAGDTVLLDAGQRVKGEYGLDSLSPFHYTLQGVERLDAIAISHAHIDHVGSLPVIHEDFQRRADARVPIYMSEPTLALSRIMLKDSAKIQHKQEYIAGGMLGELARSDFASELDLRPAYDDDKIAAALEAVVVTQPHVPYRIESCEGRLTIKLIPVAHVLGSCAIHLTDNETGATLLYTGDLGPFSEPQRTLQPFGLDTIEPADVVISESTYALVGDVEREGRRTAGRDEALEELFRAARRAQGEGGHVLLPAFSLGRTQELLQVIEDFSVTEHMPKGEVFIGGMGEQIVQVYSDHRDSVWSTAKQMSRADELHRSLGGSARTLDEVVDERVASEKFSYFIVSPALLSGGWSRAFLRRMVDEERHSVVFTGYMPPHVRGIRNFARKHTGDTIRFDEEGRHTTIRCNWRKAQLSAHAPARDLQALAKRLLRGDREVAFGTVHGSPEAQQELASYVDRLEGASAVSLENGVSWSPRRG
jgi:Cft2 family RNA processing exonuclease